MTHSDTKPSATYEKPLASENPPAASVDSYSDSSLGLALVSWHDGEHETRPWSWKKHRGTALSALSSRHGMMTISCGEKAACYKVNPGHRA